MKSAKHGKNISQVEVTNVSPIGFWLLLDNQELYLPYAKFPWFMNATIADVVRVERPMPRHLYWPNLDIDLSVDSILNPSKFPLVSTLKAKKSAKVPGRRKKATTRVFQRTV